MRFLLCLTFFVNVNPEVKAKRAISTVAVPFYHDTINIDFEVNAFPKQNLSCDDRGMRAYFNVLRQRSGDVFLNSIRQKRAEYRLNDWLSYELLQNALRVILPGQSEALYTYLEWYYLGRSGFDTRLACREGNMYLYVYTRDTVYARSFLKDEDREFINLNRPAGQDHQSGSLQMFSLAPWNDGTAFSFGLDEHPLLEKKNLPKELNFRYQNDTIRVPVRIDTGLTSIMEDYPWLGDREYLRIGLSSQAKEDLLPPLRKLIRGMSNVEALRALVAFTRTAFRYEEDEEQFGYSKPMIAEETLLYPASDCEDRCAIFYQLVKELLDLPMIIMAYPEHLTIAVALEEEIGRPIVYKGISYFVCDPTGPADSDEIGRLPIKYDNLPFEILGQ